MNESNRYMLIMIGNSNGIEKDLNYIADKEHGVDFIDTKVLFIGTFYSPFSTSEIHEKLAHRPAMMLFDITNPEDYGVNLPHKYYSGIFPEVKGFMDEVEGSSLKPKGMSRAKSRVASKKKKIEEYTSLDDILDKLSRNDYDKGCLTENEIKILEAQK